MYKTESSHNDVLCNGKVVARTYWWDGNKDERDYIKEQMALVIVDALRRFFYDLAKADGGAHIVLTQEVWFNASNKRFSGVASTMRILPGEPPELIEIHFESKDVFFINQGEVRDGDGKMLWLLYADYENGYTLRVFND